MNVLVTGGCGFIGRNLVRRLTHSDLQITVYDKDCSALIEGVSYFEENLLNFDKLKEVVKGHDVVYHLAASSSIPKGSANPKLDLENSIIATHNLLEAMRQTNVKEIVFTSSCAVYGEVLNHYSNTSIFTEDYGPLKPISLYGSAKLSCESMINAYCSLFDFKSKIFRLANIVGQNCHGIIRNLVDQLKTNPKTLKILSDGKQTRSFLLVNECVDAILQCYDYDTFNIGTWDCIPMIGLARVVADECGFPNIEIEGTNSYRGWAGDVRHIHMSIDKIKPYWKPKLFSVEAVREAARILWNTK